MRTTRPRMVSVEMTARGTTAFLSLSLTEPTLDSWLLLLASGREEDRRYSDCRGTEEETCCMMELHDGASPGTWRTTRRVLMDSASFTLTDLAVTRL